MATALDQVNAILNSDLKARRRLSELCEFVKAINFTQEQKDKLYQIAFFASVMENPEAFRKVTDMVWEELNAPDA